MLTKAQKKRIYERIRKRYKRYARRVGKPKEWKDILINGLYFKDALARELQKEEELAKKGEESRLRRSREMEDVGFDPNEIARSGGIHKKGDYFSDPNFDPRELGGLGEIWGDPEPTREEKMKAIEKEVSRQLERTCTRGICPRCKSSVCHCEEGD